MAIPSEETVSPVKAQELLKYNICNFRKIDHRLVDKYAKEMAAGKWESNGETIKLQKGGLLLDGQHRLLAIVKSGVSITTTIVRDIESDASAIDRGKPRTVGQWCSHLGIKNATRVAAVAKLVIAYRKGFWTKSTFQANDIIDSEIIEFVEQHANELEECTKQSSRAKNIAPASILGSVLFVGCHGENPSNFEVSRWFIHSLSTGENISSEDAVFHFRNRMLNQNQFKQTSAYMKRMLLTIAWNKTVLGEPCTAQGLRIRVAGPHKQAPPEEILSVCNL